MLWHFLFVLNDLKTTANKREFDDTAFNIAQSKLTKLKRNPFNQTSVNFDTPDYKVRSGLGPAQYRISVYAKGNLRKSIVEDGKKSHHSL